MAENETYGELNVTRHTPVAVLAAGMVTAVGFNGLSSCAAIRAGITGIKEENLWDAESGTYLHAGSVPLPHWWVGAGKWAELLAPAIHECLEAAGPLAPDRIPILLGLPPQDRPYRFSDLESRIVDEIEHRLGFAFHQDSTVISRDHVSLAVALERANALFNTGDVRCCIIACVDSLIQQELVEHYLENRRLLTPINSNGFTVGEAGSAILVSAWTPDPQTDVLKITGTGTGLEKATIESEDPLRADGLTRAIGEALDHAGLTMDDMHYRISDLNGEHYKFKEMTLAMMRYSRKPKPYNFDLWHPIEYIGDVGAAIGPVLAAVARHAGIKDCAVGPNVLITLGNDNGERSAIVASFEKGAASS